ncbi:hypothetical protein HDU82_005783 [Entophlyctis luteolus]|nr:hypothetical protein HDU82_005783 [Entophlyctis luteolus]
MLTTGSLNTILNKFQDLQCVRDCEGPSPKLFEQPVWQTLTMFAGECGCLAVYLLFQWRSASKQNTTADRASDESAALIAPAEGGVQDGDDSEYGAPELRGAALLWLWLPTVCDLLATTLMNVGLLFVSASIYQMLRGSVVLFTGLFSTIFLGRKHPGYRWFALFTVFVGVSIVGASSVIDKKLAEPSYSFLTLIKKEPEESAATALFGVLLVVLAQCFTATQFVVEEKVIGNYYVDTLKAVGFEGAFGLLTGAIVLPPVYFLYGQYQGPDNYFNVVEGFHEVFEIKNILYAGKLPFSCVLIVTYGLSVTQNVSATSRSTIDTCRTVFIWAISMGLGWETFKWLQVIGFMVLIYGTFVFNDVVALPRWMGLGAPLSGNGSDGEDDEI